MYLADMVIATNSGKTLEIVALIRINVFTAHLASAEQPCPFSQQTRQVPT